MVTEHERETSFLRHVIRYDGSEERRKLEYSIAEVQRDQRCVQRVASVTALFPMLALAAVGYEVILQDNFPFNGTGIVYRLLCEIGVASMICLMIFVGVLTVYRLKLNRLREECRQLVKRLLESHLGKPDVPGDSDRRVTPDSGPLPQPLAR